ncbi:MAG: hypothetical protein WCP82_04575 [Alphaproteobacteria bacterium]
MDTSFPETDKKPAKNIGGRPRKPVDTASPEFQRAVAVAAEAAVAAALPAIMAKMASLRGVAPDALNSDDTGLANKLAAAIGEMNDAQSGRKRLTPDEIRTRAEGRDLLTELILKAKDDPENKPHYRVVAKTYLTDYVIEPYQNNDATKSVEPTMIDWDGVPNDCLLPANDKAFAIFDAFRQAIGGETAVDADMASKLDGRAYGITQGGLVVKGLSSAQRRDVTTLEPGSTTNVTGIRGPNDPRAKNVNVLGTIAEAAKSQSHNGGANFAGNLKVG